MSGNLDEPLGRHGIDFGDDDDAIRYAEQVDDRQMFAGLRHDAVVGGDNKQREVNAACAGQHGMHETLVTGNVDEAEDVAVSDRKIGEAEVDRDPACLLLLQPIGIDTRQGFDERGLAMIDMTGGADDHRNLSWRPRSGRCSDVQGGEDGQECVLALQTAQIEQQSVVDDPADHGAPQPA